MRQVMRGSISSEQLMCGGCVRSIFLLISHLSSIINIILCIVNLCFSSGDFPASCKSAIISLLIKKQGLDSENYRPVANLSFIKKK